MLENINNAKSVSDGLKQFKCERNINNRPPILYIPEKDAIAEVLNKKSFTIKVKLQEGMICGTPEEFLNHAMRISARYMLNMEGWSRDQWDEWKVTKKRAEVDCKDYKKVISGKKTIQGLSVDKAKDKLESEKSAWVALRSKMTFKR